MHTPCVLSYPTEVCVNTKVRVQRGTFALPYRCLLNSLSRFSYKCFVQHGVAKNYKFVDPGRSEQLAACSFDR